MPDPEDPGRLRRDTVTATAWSGIGALVAQLLGLVFSIVLARLLAPEEFGVLAMAATATGVAAVLSEVGFATLLMQRREVTQSLLSTIFWAQLALGLVATGILLALAHPIASFYRDDSLRGVLTALAVVPAVTVVSGLPRVLLARALNFKRIVAIDICSMVIAGAAGIALAATGAGVWALVVQALSGAVAVTLGRYAVTRWRPSPTFSWGELREVSGFTGAVYGHQLLTFLFRNGDNVLVGRFLGATQLAFYARSYTLLLIPSRRVSQVLGGTMQIALSKAAHDVKRCQRMYVEATEMVAFITAPAMLTLAVVMPELVDVVLGPRWSGMVAAATWLCCLGAIEPLTTTTGWIFVARGRPDIGLKLTLAAGPAWLLGVGVGVWFESATAVAAGVAVVGTLFGPIYLARAAALLETDVWHLARALAPGYLCALAAPAGGLIVTLVLRRTDAPDVITLLAGAAAAVLSLVVVSSLVRPRAWVTTLGWLRTIGLRVGARIRSSSAATEDPHRG
jgi:O-antigen/teichoic acid export membrane protein